MSLPPIKVVQLGERLKTSTRRVVNWLGTPCLYETPIGTIGGVADGAVIFRTRFGKQYDLSLEEALEIAKALERSAYGVRDWRKVAQGHFRLRITREENGVVFATCLGRKRPMRLSHLGVRRRGKVLRRGVGERNTRECYGCKRYVSDIYVAADDLREHGSRVQHVEVCEACVERLAKEREPDTAPVLAFAAKQEDT